MSYTLKQDGNSNSYATVAPSDWRATMIQTALLTWSCQPLHCRAHSLVVADEDDGLEPGA